MRCTHVVVLTVALVLAAGCAPTTRTDSGAASRADAAGARDAAGTAHTQIPVEGVADVMRAKLAHAQAIIEGIAIEDFGQVRINAAALRSLSREAGWRVHTTVAYGVHSDDFRKIVSTLADHAADRDLEAVTLDYVQMTQSCVRCHKYMRKEGLYRDVPGEVSLGPTERLPHLDRLGAMETP